MKPSLKAVPAVIGIACLITAALSIAPAPSLATDPGDGRSPRAMIVLVPADGAQRDDYDERITYGFDGLPGVAVGLISATQGSYSRDQALLDISQGARVSRSTYDPTDVPPVTLLRRGSGGLLKGWGAILDRAATAPQTIEPGLLSSSVEGGAALVVPSGVAKDMADIAFPASGRNGSVKTLVEIPGDGQSIADAARKALADRRLAVVVTLPGEAGLVQFAELVERRRDGDLLIGLQAPPDAAILPLLGVGVAGLGTNGGELTSKTTNLPGLVGGIDIAPTILDHLGIAVPAEMTGVEMTSRGEGDAASLTSFRERLNELGPRRSPAIAAVAAAWVVLFLAAGVLLGRERARLPVRRIGGLAVLWLPFVTLLTATFGNPSRELELISIGVLCLLFGFLSDRLLPWPRATILPAVFGIGAVTIDLAMGSELITRSVLGPNPGYGSRFYGVGNELKSGLTVLMLAGLAGAIGSRPKSGKLALVVLLAGLVLGAILGSGRLGAGVGAAIIVAAASAVAAVMMLPGAMTGRRIALLVASPIIGLALLAGLDLLTSGGEGHYIRNVIQDGSLSSFADTVERRTTLAWQQLWRDTMPLATLLALLAALWAIRNRAIYRPFYGPIWPAALVGGLAGGVIGSLTEDSGPLLLVGAVLMLAGVSAYLLGRPGAGEEPDPETREAAGSVTG